MKRLFPIAWIVLIMTISIFVWFKPMSVNTLNYLIWKSLTSTQVEAGNIEYQGAKIHYVSYGQGEPILLLHGGLSNKLSWFSQIPWLVSSGRRVILIDTRGHGYSTKGHSKLSYQIFTEDTLQVLDKLGIQRTDVVGWSDGGIIALLLGLEAPQRIGKIIAISANFHPSGVLPETDSTPSVAEHFLLKPITDWVRGIWSGAGEQHPSLEAEIKTLWRTEPQLGQTDLQAITAPTMVVVGENDIIDLKHSNDLARLLANGRIEVIIGAGHAAPVTHAQQINQLIASFLGIY
jgi:pimeloyl-ACP methyl ester carboxylesterase